MVRQKDTHNGAPKTTDNKQKRCASEFELAYATFLRCPVCLHTRPHIRPVLYIFFGHGAMGPRQPLLVRPMPLWGGLRWHEDPLAACTEDLGSLSGAGTGEFELLACLAQTG